MELSKGLYKIVVKRDTDQLANIIEFNLKFLPNLYFVHNLFTLLVAFHMFSLITFKFESSKSNFIFIIVADMTNLIPSANSTKFKHVGNILISHVSPATCLHWEDIFQDSLKFSLYRPFNMHRNSQIAKYSVYLNAGNILMCSFV